MNARQDASEDLPPEITRWASLAGPKRVLDAARQRLENGQRSGRLRLAIDLNADERAQLSQLLGLDWRASALPVTLGLLHRALRARNLTLEHVITAAGGPLHDRAGERAEARQAARQTTDDTRAILTAAGLSDAVAHAAQTRWLGPRSQQLENAQRLSAVLAELPAPADTLLSAFASTVLHDPHALDKNTTLGRATARVLHVAAVIDGVDHHASDTARSDTDPPVAGVSASAAADAAVSAALGQAGDALDTDRWRETWASVGIACDRVSSTVLVLNVPLLVDSDHSANPPDRSARQQLHELSRVAIGQPLWLTARMIEPGFAMPANTFNGVTVRVCENPAVIETIADALAAAAPPVVCTYGQPSATARALLAALSNAGAQLLISADRDAAGIGISDSLLDLLNRAHPWLPDVPGIYEEDRLAALVADCQAASAVQAARSAETDCEGQDPRPIDTRHRPEPGGSSFGGVP